MAIEIARRSFLFGMAAAVAATQLRMPMAIAAPSPVAETFYLRKYFMIEAMCDNTPFEFFLRREGIGVPILHLYGTHSLHWHAGQRDGILLPSDQSLIVDCCGGADPLKIRLFFSEQKESGGAERGFVENHMFPQRTLVTTIPMDAAA